jgi:peroxiredoxin
VDKVVCVTVGDPAQVQKWAAENGFDKDTVSDRQGSSRRGLRAGGVALRTRSAQWQQADWG